MHLAQLNIATAKYPLDSKELKDFTDNLDPVNQIADGSEGFVWRLQDESGDATGIQVFDDPRTIVNMSVWKSVDELKNFMFRTFHRDILRRKKEWFHTPAEPTHVLWWIPETHTPSLPEALERLQDLRDNGENPRAFTLSSNFTADEVATYD